jgi:glucose/arabinose dehydrogenase
MNGVPTYRSWCAVFWGLLAGATLAASSDTSLRAGTAAFGDWRADAPGVRRLIRATDLPAPYATRSSASGASILAAPANARPLVPPGFTVRRLLAGLDNPRVLRVAPNGDIFLVETSPGRIRVLRASSDPAVLDRVEVYATGLDAPFGLAFYPAGDNPQWVYVANNNSVVRFVYRNGDLAARGKPEVVIPKLSVSSGGHSTRDIALSRDGATFFVAVGSGSNVAQDLPRLNAAQLRTHETQHGIGAAWGNELQRAAVLSFNAIGDAALQPYATGIRNCVGMTIHSGTGDLWCAVNERDGLGDNLVPDYVMRVKRGAFYGWPWYYIGSHADPRHRNERADLKDQVTTPDVLLQAHSAALGVVEYRGRGGSAAFPAEYEGDLLVALHGSWNRAQRTGYKVVRVHLKSGVPSGEYTDFMTGLVLDEAQVWGRPVGIAVAHDGALLVSDDGGNVLWRVSYEGARTRLPATPNRATAQ